MNVLNTSHQPNRLIDETSPYLLQHAYNPVHWYPWGEEALSKARTQDKPIFLSIGYSSCHWCHVMERESFENKEIAAVLNKYFISIKVDKEERPDIDSIYMRVCQAVTGSGGWPTSIFLAPDQMPLYAGTYFPPAGFLRILQNIAGYWQDNRSDLLQNAQEILAHIQQDRADNYQPQRNLTTEAFALFSQSFDTQYGGFGEAPKFPSPHNLLFLMGYATAEKEPFALEMVETTLLSMYKGGIFDHIGFGFSRYSTDDYWLAPHFEKMLYDNALLAVAYLVAYEQTGKDLYRQVACKIFIYVERELTNETGGFFSSQDADSDGVEGKYYVFTPDEVTKLLGHEDGTYFCQNFDITIEGNFEGKSIPNLIEQSTPLNTMEDLLPKLSAYRKQRTSLHRDDKILTGWNALLLGAYATAYRVLGEECYLYTAETLLAFIDTHLWDGEALYASITSGRRGTKGFLDDYAFLILALIELYEATFEDKYLERALQLTNKTIADFFDQQNGGFYFTPIHGEKLILRPKEHYDGAIPSGNSVMAYALKALSALTKDESLYTTAEKQQTFMQGKVSGYPAGSSFFLLSQLPQQEIICVLEDASQKVPIQAGPGRFVRILQQPTQQYPLLNGKTTFYLCKGKQCMPPVNEPPVFLNNQNVAD